MMNNTAAGESSSQAIVTVIRVVILGLLFAWCLQIILPFVQPVAWGMIIAVAAYPIYKALVAKLGGREKMAAGLFSVIMLALLLVPTVELAFSVSDSSSGLIDKIQQGELKIAPPPEKVKSLPLIGEKVYSVWSASSENLEALLAKNKERVAQIAKTAFSLVTGAGFSILQFALSIIIAGVFLVNAEACKSFSHVLSVKLAGEAGESFTKLAGDTVSSVVKGVLGVAIIQAVFSGVGMLVMDIPGAGIWALLVLLLAIMQLPPLVVLGPVAAYAFSAYDSTPATIFLVWCIFISVSDGFLKPMLLGRGLSTPMLVILIGAIGGMMMSGIIGLFVGSVVLSLAYELSVAWLYGESQPGDKPETEEAK
ncbi:MAG: AI-2E family transporter [Pseudomonadales bacterium]